MTRGQLIRAIYDNEDVWSCPYYSCDIPEKQCNTAECCWDCAEKLLKAYEVEIQIDAIDIAIHHLYNSKVNCHQDYFDGIDFAIGVLSSVADQFKGAKQ